jgi:hypothetical protein
MNIYLLLENLKMKKIKKMVLVFKKTLNIIILNNNSPKNIAEGIIEQINDVDNFHWRYV